MTTSHIKKFHQNFSFQKRRETATSILTKYSERVPVIVDRAPGSNLPIIDKFKFLAPRDISVGKFLFEIRKHMELPSDKAMFIFIGSVMPSSSQLMGTIYENHKSDDAFLYVLYSGENTFG